MVPRAVAQALGTPFRSRVPAPLSDLFEEEESSPRVARASRSCGGDERQNSLRVANYDAEIRKVRSEISINQRRAAWSVLATKCSRHVDRK